MLSHLFFSGKTRRDVFAAFLKFFSCEFERPRAGVKTGWLPPGEHGRRECDARLCRSRAPTYKSEIVSASLCFGEKEQKPKR